jgi:hypothetical protein
MLKSKLPLFMFAAWLVFAALPDKLMAFQSKAGLVTAPVPLDPHELVTGLVQIAALPSDREAALSLLRRASDNAISHQPTMNPFNFTVSFVANGHLTYTGQGELTETWKSGQNWRVTERIGDYSLVRVGYSGQIADEKPISMIPMRAQMLRNEVMWRASSTVNAAGTAQIRTSASQWNGKPVTCVLISHVGGAAAQVQSRLWEESEYCIANDSGLLQTHSVAPGVYTVFDFGKNLTFHGKSLPDHITTYVAGAQANQADLSIADFSADSAGLLIQTQEMLANGRPAIALSEPLMIPIDLPSTGSTGTIQPVVLHVELDAQGNVHDVELSATADAKLTSAALDAAKKLKLGRTGANQAYIIVRFIPASPTQ